MDHGGLLEELLDQQLSDDIVKAMQNPSQTLICPLCGIEKQSHHFSRISEKCEQFGHSFCLECISKELTRCIQQNQEIFCIIDACPHKISDNQVFLSSFPQEIRENLAKWKKSPSYRKRKKTIRMSFHDRLSSYSRSKIQPSQLIQQDVEKKPNQQFYLVEPEQIDNDDKLQVRTGKLNGTSVKTDVSDQEQMNLKNKNKKKKRPKRRSSNSKRNKFVQNEEEEEEEEEKMNILIQNFPVPHPVPALAPGQEKKQDNFRVAYENRPYTFFRLIGKAILLAIGLPIVFVEGIFFFSFTIVFYLLFVTSFFSVLSFLAGCFYYSIYEQDKLYLGFVCLLGIVFGIGLFRLCINIQALVQYLCVRNMWILWRRQLRMICKYPDLPYYVRS